jgi:ferritin-like metal-binding protein YciE
MSKLKSLEDLLILEIKDLFSAENQLLKALPKMARSASEPSLKAAFENHLKETQVHVERLQKVADMLDETPRGKSCKAMEGLIDEGEEVIREDADHSIKDLALIIAAQKIEHYEMAGYGSARALAYAIGHEDAADVFQTTLDEEEEADQNLTMIAEDIMGDQIQSEIS